MSYALVTGAAKGIGKGIALELARRQYHLLLVDIDGEGLLKTARELQSTYAIEVHVLQQDLTAPGATARILQWTTPRHAYLSVVVNNAGYGLNGAFEQLGLEEQLNMIDLNIKGQVTLSHAYIPVLMAHTRSYLLNVGSTTAYQPVPYLTIYAASKAFVISFTRGLRYELRHSPVSVSCLIPGSTDTDFVNRARMSATTKKTAERFNMTPELVGKLGVEGLIKGKATIIPGISNKLHAFLPRFFSTSFVEKIAGSIYGPSKQQPTHNNSWKPLTR